MSQFTDFYKSVQLFQRDIRREVLTKRQKVKSPKHS